jgi:hypothetical protein
MAPTTAVSAVSSRNLFRRLLHSMWGEVRVGFAA